MKEKRVSKLLKDIGVILSKENINRVKDGVYFKIVNKNEDGKCNYLLRINEDNKEKEATEKNLCWNCATITARTCGAWTRRCV